MASIDNFGIEEEDEELPAIGHLDDFSIPVNKDGCPMPATVKARMPDGSYQTVTLIPQNVEDGSVIYTVQFEEELDKTAVVAQSVQNAGTIDFSNLTEKVDCADITKKIDRILEKNENIRNTLPAKVTKEVASSKGRSLLKPNILREKGNKVKKSSFLTQTGRKVQSEEIITTRQLELIQSFFDQNPVVLNELVQSKVTLLLHEEGVSPKTEIHNTNQQEPENKGILSQNTADTPFSENTGLLTESVPNVKLENDSDFDEDSADETSNKTKKFKLSRVSRTRCGRLSRPPSFIEKHYKDLIHTKAEFPDVESVSSIVPKLLPAPKRKSTKRNFGTHVRCPGCHKVYLAKQQMLRHFKKFPDHNMIFAQDGCKMARNGAKKIGVPLLKLKKVLSSLDRKKLTTYFTPLLVDLFTLWDFLLLRVAKLASSGCLEFNAFLQEVTSLLDKLSKVGEELLTPVFTRSSKIDENVVEIDRMDVAMALGIETGLYKINTDQLHLIKLSEDSQQSQEGLQPDYQESDVEMLEQSNASNGPTQLATKFEPNLSTKLLECSNDSMDIDSNSKDLDENRQKTWSDPKTEDTNSELLSELLSELPPNEALWSEKSKKLEKPDKSNWLKMFKDSTQVPKNRTGRLTSTPEPGPSRSLFTEPIRRNSVSGFEERREDLGLHDLLDDFLPDGSNARNQPRRPISCIEKIINETLFTGPAPPPNIPDHLDENLDFLNQ